jgi:uncharacterized membrane protein HdeD (DUF308 family)
MTTHNHTTHWGLLLAKALIYIVVGAFIIITANSFTTLSGQIIGGLYILAGVCQLVFSFTNRGVDRSNIWGIVYGLNDLVFGIAIFIYAKSATSNIGDTLAFWAMVYAVLQSVQAMYSFIAARGGTGIPVSSMLLHAINVLIAGGMSYVLLSFTTGFDSSMRLVGLFPIVLGVLLIILTQVMRAQAAQQHDHQIG